MGTNFGRRSHSYPDIYLGCDRYHGKIICKSVERTEETIEIRKGEVKWQVFN